MRVFLLVALLGGLVSLLRYAVFVWGKNGDFPLPDWGVAPETGTAALLLVNLVGGLVAGLATNMPPQRLSPNARIIIIVGFCGGLTSFSTFSHQALVMMAVDPAQALFYAVGSVALCLVAVVIGHVIAGWFF